MPSRTPLLNNANNLSDLFSSAVVIQNYPEKYIVEGHRPRKHHESFNLAGASGHVFGQITDNGKHHWTRYIMFKPSQQLLAAWEASSLSGQIIESLVFNKINNTDTYALYAGYMKGIGTKLIGYLSGDDLRQLKKQAWEVELLDNLLLVEQNKEVK